MRIILFAPLEFRDYGELIPVPMVRGRGQVLEFPPISNLPKLTEGQPPLRPAGLGDVARA